MRLIPDTHVVLWWAHGDRRLSDAAREALSDGRAEVLLSAAVAWEIAIKQGVGKLSARRSMVSDLLRAGARELPISIAHTLELERLPDHHRDPFDRILVAQARVENAVLITADAALVRYGAPVLW